VDFAHFTRASFNSWKITFIHSANCVNISAFFHH